MIHRDVVVQGALQFEVLNQRLLDREKEVEELRRQNRNYVLENKRLVGHSTISSHSIIKSA